MIAVKRALAGAVSGFLATFVLSGLRETWRRAGLIFETAPMQVVDRVEEVGLIENWSPGARRLLTVIAHFAYGSSIGTAFGLLRREPGGLVEEAAVGSALGMLAWGAGWATWLPLTGVHSPPWSQKTPRVLLPVVDHAFYGAAWGIIYWLLSRRHA